MPLTAGLASTVSVGDMEASLAATDATSGTLPYTYQWQRGTAPGGPFPNVPGLSSSLTLNDSGLTNGVTYYYRLIYTDSLSATATSNTTTAIPGQTKPATGSTTEGAKTKIRYTVGALESDISREYGTTSATTTVLCTIAFDKTEYFLYEMLGYSTHDGSNLKRMLPEQMPYLGVGRYSNGAGQYALSAKLHKNMGGWTSRDLVNKGWPNFQNSVWSVTFGAPLYRVKEDAEVTYEHERFCIFKTRGVAENEKIPGGGFFIKAGEPDAGKPVNEVGIKTGRTVQLEIKWIDVPYVNYTKISGIANKVNAADWVVNGITYKAQTVLFQTWVAEPRINAFGSFTNDITFTYSIRQDDRTWNKFWLLTSSGVKNVGVEDAAGLPPFATGNMNDAFSFA